MIIGIIASYCYIDLKVPLHDKMENSTPKLAREHEGGPGRNADRQVNYF